MKRSYDFAGLLATLLADELLVFAILCVHSQRSLWPRKKETNIETGTGWAAETQHPLRKADLR